MDSAILLPTDGGLEISSMEGKSEAKSSEGKYWTISMKVTMAMVRCAFLGARGGRDVRGVWIRGRHR